jgi:hypothetical protein
MPLFFPSKMVLDAKVMHSGNGAVLPISLDVPWYVFTPTFI